MLHCNIACAAKASCCAAVLVSARVCWTKRVFLPVQSLCRPETTFDSIRALSRSCWESEASARLSAPAGGADQAQVAWAARDIAVLRLAGEAEPTIDRLSLRFRRDHGCDNGVSPIHLVTRAMLDNFTAGAPRSTNMRSL